jgi:hypothetical protein
MPHYDYIERVYGKTFTAGQRVRFTEGGPRAGTVMRPRPSHEHYIQVRFDGEKNGSLCHPGSVEPEAA